MLKWTLLFLLFACLLLIYQVCMERMLLRRRMKATDIPSCRERAPQSIVDGLAELVNHMTDGHTRPWDIDNTVRVQRRQIGLPADTGPE